jgi:hypothetical protein
MATFTEIQGRYVKLFRNVRRVYRQADTAGEKLQRELDRLVKRRRLIQPSDLQGAIRLYNLYDSAVGQIARALADAQTFLALPVVM